jgi:murein DD-endopeptidase MepM/ murein hydrolase activator NlpD
VPVPDVPPPSPDSIPGAAPTLVIVDPANERTGEFTIGYYGEPEQLSPGWSVDIDALGRPRAYRPAIYNAQTLYVGYQPRLTGKGQYAVEAYIPRDHGDARDVRYTLVHYPNGLRQEVTCILNQEPYSDQWAPLQGNIIDGQAGGPLVNVFDLDPAFDDAGRVNVADATFVDPRTSPSGRFEITFGSLRWRPTTALPPAVTGFDSPVGTEAERAGPIAAGGKYGVYPLWAGNWYDANPIGSRYLLSNGYARHTGADVNLSGGVLADKYAPVHAVADGRVISASFVSIGWKNIIIIEHPVPGEDRLVYARYAHVANMLVKAGDPVQRGQQIASVGEYAPDNWHLHFDISHTTVLKTVPGHWPGDNLDLVYQHYSDPLAFIKQRHTVR